jgi:assimilatory nitrate reductase catalytic subunit
MTQEVPKTIKTTCPYCGVGCGVLATQQEDGSLDIKGDPDHPANFGRLCSKGSALGETVSLDDRILEPEINGQISTWDESLDLVAKKFSETIKEHGSDSVAFYVSGQILTEDYYLANKLMKGYIGSANIDTNSRLCMASSVAGHKRAFGSDTVPGCYEDLELADLIVLTGSNLAWCHPVLYQRIMAAKQSRPEMKVVLIDPRRTMTADIADLHLPISADGDVALFTGLFKHLCENGFEDRSFVDNYTAGLSDALAALEDISIDQISAATSLNVSDIEQFYALFAATEKTVTVYSQGVNQSKSGSDKVNAIINCHLATGRIGKPGMGPFSVTGQPNAMGGREVGGLANMLAAHMAIENPDHRDLVQTFWQSPTIASETGLKAVDMFKAVKDGRIKALWVMATNPAVSMPQADEVKEAIENCPFVVVSDVIHSTDTVALADVKLPSLAWGEKDGTVTNSERRISRQKAMLPPAGSAKADWWQLAEVGKRMGFGDAFNYPDARSVFIEHAKLSGYKNDGKRDFDVSGLSDISSIEYDELKPVQWPIVGPERSVKTRFFAKGEFYTPTKRANILPVAFHANIKAESDKLTLNTGRIRDHWHTMTRTGRSSRLSSHLGEPYCEIHPVDAERLELEPASLVEISSEHGTIIVRALITKRQQKGSVFVPMHWTDQFAAKARVDVLVPSITDPVSGQPALKSAIVDVKRAKMSAYGLLVSRHKPTATNFDYWALSKCVSGWKLEFAVSSIDELDFSDQSVWGMDAKPNDISYLDQETGRSRYAWFDDEQLDAALFLSKSPVEVSRNWAAEQLSKIFETNADRYKIIAGRPSVDQPDKGQIICSCLSIGSNEIIGAIHKGCLNLDAIGDATGAGTNCGSCRAEISEIIHENQILAAE